MPVSAEGQVRSGSTTFDRMIGGRDAILDQSFRQTIVFYNAPEAQAQPAVATAAIGPCPYPGLAFFSPSDSHLFFGRNAAVSRLVAAIERQNLTALLGASGSGKSSVALAGLPPALQKRGNWTFSYFRIGVDPDADPFRALARGLVPFYIEGADPTDRLAQASKLAAGLKTGAIRLRDVFAAHRHAHPNGWILFIGDQFEEAFTLVTDDDLRKRFIDCLLDGFPAGASQSNISLLLTMRADFYGRALQYRPLSDRLQNRVENLGPMSREELRDTIVKPAEQADAVFEPGLVETILDEVEGEPASLPLLQFALRAMWERLQSAR